jgi:2,4-dienoyl-CoA reductase (NADPH2)
MNQVGQRGQEKLHTIFNQFKIGPHTLKNRLVALPVFTGYAMPQGKVSPLLLEHYSRMANSGVAMVVVANASVSADGVTSVYNLRVDIEDCVPGLARLAGAIKRGGAVACLQLNHAGRIAKTAQPMLPSPFSSSNLAFEMNSLEAFFHTFPRYRRFGLIQELLKRMVTWRRSMTNEDRERVISNFGEAAARACEAGFDVVELHGASGYLLTQFLSAYTNKTSGDADDSFQNRVSFPMAVLKEVKRCLPEGFPVGFRLLLREWVPDGIDIPEATSWAKLLEAHGIAYLSVTSGTYNSFFLEDVRKEMAGPAYLQKDAAALTREVNVPIIISGRIVTPSIAEKLLQEGVADLIGLGRPLVADIDWLRKIDREDKIKDCRNCYFCLKQVVLEQGLICRQWPQWLKDRIELDHKLLTRGLDRGLLVAANAKDLQMIRNLLRSLIPPNPDFSTTVLFIKTKKDHKPFNTDEVDFIEQSRNLWQRRNISAGRLDYSIKVSGKSFDETVRSEIGQGEYGLIIIGRNQTELWRTRLLYKEQGKAIGLIGSSNRQTQVLVAVDLSDATLLALRFSCYFFLGRPDYQLTFVHILEGHPEPVKRRWEEIRKILGWDEDFQLTLPPSKGGVAASLLEVIQEGEYGTILMGKRGLSKIKHSLLGSVSGAVLRGLTNQSLFLID